MKQVELAGVAIEHSSGSPIALLQERDAPHRLLPIFIGGPEAASIAVAASGQDAPRPLTHDLMATLLETFDARVATAEVTDLQDGAFLARLTITGGSGEHHFDTRPSDAIALAIRAGAPILVSEAVLDEAGSVPPEDNNTDIDETVDAFRSFLDEVDPAQFATGELPSSSPTETGDGDAALEADDE